jgi:hypothetical protein
MNCRIRLDFTKRNALQIRWRMGYRTAKAKDTYYIVLQGVKEYFCGFDK